MLRQLKFFILLPLVLLLAACHADDSYGYFMKNPTVLRQALVQCGTKQTRYCEKARITAHVLSEFSALAASQRHLFMLAQEGKLDQAQRQELFNAQNAIQLRFGQKIMNAQAKLVQLEGELQKAQGQKRADLHQAIERQRQLIDAMRTLVSLNNPE